MQSRCARFPVSTKSVDRGAYSQTGRVLEGVARKRGVAIFTISLSGYVLVCSKRSDLLHAEPGWKSTVTFSNGLELVDVGAVLGGLFHGFLGSDLGVVVCDLVADGSLGMKIHEVRLCLTFLHHISLHLECICYTIANWSLGVMILVN